jgi:menaquinol-cytochrome c reductase iron-sulfur subunit
MNDDLSRRGVLMKLGLLVNGAVAALLAVPIIGYLLAAVGRKGGVGYMSWITLGALSEFPEGQTRMATFRNPTQWADTAQRASA